MSPEASTLNVVENVACTVCGCVCDDLRVTVKDNRVVRAEGACGLAEPWYLGQGTHHPAEAELDRRPIPLDVAVAHGAQWLRDARSPLIYGLSRSSTAGQRSAIALAEQLGATIDTNASMCHAPSVMAIQDVGEVTCTLGEVKNRADLVIFWGVNPVVSHPRHLERYSLYPEGRSVPDGRAGRTLVVVDVKPTATTELADLFLPIERGKDFEALTALHRLVRGLPVPRPCDVGVPIEALEDLAGRMKRCRYGICFFGLGLSMTRMGQHNVEALLRLVRDLNRFTRFSARRMRIPGDVTGADIVLAWQTGYPFSVNFARGYPRYNPDEFSAQGMLERGEVDACLFVGSEGAERFSSAARATLARIPVIALDYPNVPSIPETNLRFTTAIYGIHHPGTAYRMDCVPIPLRAFLESPYPTDHSLLDRIARAVSV